MIQFTDNYYSYSSPVTGNNNSCRTPPLNRLFFFLFFISPLPEEGGGILFYLCPSVRPRYFSSHFSQLLLMAEIWYLVTSVIYKKCMCTILWVAFLDPSDSYFLFADLVVFYAHFSSHFSQQLLMAEIWYLVTSFISWEAFFDPSDSYFLFAEERGYHKWALAHSSSCLFMIYCWYISGEIICLWFIVGIFQGR